MTSLVPAHSSPSLCLLVLTEISFNHNGARSRCRDYRCDVRPALPLKQGGYLTTSALYNSNGPMAMIAFLIFLVAAIGFWYRAFPRPVRVHYTPRLIRL
jgi:hypothetical protein